MRAHQPRIGVEFPWNDTRNESERQRGISLAKQCVAEAHVHVTESLHGRKAELRTKAVCSHGVTAQAVTHLHRAEQGTRVASLGMGDNKLTADSSVVTD